MVFRTYNFALCLTALIHLVRSQTPNDAHPPQNSTILTENTTINISQNESNPHSKLLKILSSLGHTNDEFIVIRNPNYDLNEKEDHIHSSRLRNSYKDIDNTDPKPPANPSEEDYISKIIYSYPEGEVEFPEVEYSNPEIEAEFPVVEIEFPEVEIEFPEVEYSYPWVESKRSHSRGMKNENVLNRRKRKVINRGAHYIIRSSSVNSPWSSSTGSSSQGGDGHLPNRGRSASSSNGYQNKLPQWEVSNFNTGTPYSSSNTRRVNILRQKKPRKRISKNLKEEIAQYALRNGALKAAIRYEYEVGRRLQERVIEKFARRYRKRITKGRRS